jgi:hypothetical protein
VPAPRTDGNRFRRLTCCSIYSLLAVTQWHYAVGATAKTPQHSELSFALVDVPTGTVSGPNPLEVPGRQQITLAMHQLEFEVGYARKY